MFLGRIEPGGRCDTAWCHQTYMAAVKNLLNGAGDRPSHSKNEPTSNHKSSILSRFPANFCSRTPRNRPRLGPISICVDFQPRGQILRSFRGTPKSSGFLCEPIYSSCRSCRPESSHFLCWDGLSALKVTAPATMFQSQ